MNKISFRFIFIFFCIFNFCLLFIEYVNKEQLRLSNKDSIVVSMKRLNKTFGYTGLVLSGGGMLGIHHLGVIDTLVKENLLPKVIFELMIQNSNDKQN